MLNNKSNQLSGIKYAIAFIYCIPLVFICGYTFLLHTPISTITDHLLVITLATAALFAIDAKVALLNLSDKLVRTYLALTRGSLLLFFIIYYSLVIISISSWGKVITKEIIYSYTAQAEHLLNTLGISSILVIICLLSLAALCIYISHKAHKHYKLLSIPHNYASRKLILLLSASILTFSLYYLYEHSFAPYRAYKVSEEPLFLTAHSGKPKLYAHTLNHGLKRDPHLEQKEELVRNAYAPNPNAKKKNIIILLSDALRPDHMSLNGYDRKTTPNLEAYEKLGQFTQLNNVKTTCGETACSHASLFASRYVHEMPLNMLSLQEVLNNHGYDTKFLISGDHIHFQNMRDSVYKVMDEYYDGTMQEKHFFNDDRVVIDKVNSLPDWDGTPTFMHFHLLSNHVVGPRLDEFNIYKPYENYAGLRIGNTNQAYINHYDNGVTQADWVMHTLIQTLKSKQYLDDAIVIIMSDHGESLGEHNKLVHTNSVYEQLLNIPLIFIEFGKPSLTTLNKDKLTSIIDIAPTILTELDMPIPSTWKGTPLQSKKTYENVYFEMMPYAGFYHKTDNSRSIKYWRNVRTHEEFMYDVNVDQAEIKNIIWSVNKALRTKVRNIYNDTYGDKIK